MAANIGSAVPGGVASIQLANATPTSGGAVVRLSANGQTILSVTRLAAQVEDLAIDANDNIYVAAWNNGVIKINSAANLVLWQQNPGRVSRVDAGGARFAVALVTTATNPDIGNPGSGAIYLYNASGAQVTTFAGKSNTLDVCLDAVSQTIVTIGWRQANAFDGTATYPVQIAYLRGTGFDGVVKYTGYDWSTEQGSPRFINRPENNMADTRGYRCTIGADNNLYAAYEVAGGNHIFRYSPFDVSVGNPIVGGDQWHEFYNTRSEHKTFFARHNPATGDYL